MSKLIEMREKYPQTELWTDSFHTADHAYGLTQGITYLGVPYAVQ